MQLGMVMSMVANEARRDNTLKVLVGGRTKDGGRRTVTALARMMTCERWWTGLGRCGGVLSQFWLPVALTSRAAAGDVQSKSGPLGLKTCTFIDIVFMHVMLEAVKDGSEAGLSRKPPTFPTLEGMKDEGYPKGTM
jgi:hypothetical protein